MPSSQPSSHVSTILYSKGRTMACERHVVARTTVAMTSSGEVGSHKPKGPVSLVAMIPALSLFELIVVSTSRRMPRCNKFPIAYPGKVAASLTANPGRVSPRQVKKGRTGGSGNNMVNPYRFLIQLDPSEIVSHCLSLQPLPMLSKALGRL